MFYEFDGGVSHQFRDAPAVRISDFFREGVLFLRELNRDFLSAQFNYNNNVSGRLFVHIAQLPRRIGRWLRPIIREYVTQEVQLLWRLNRERL